MREYNEKDAIRNLQTYLRQLAYDDTQMPAPPIDGIFDTVTRDALQYFQEENGLAPTGRADRMTWELLYRAYLASLKTHKTPTPLYLFPRVPPNYTVSPTTPYYLIAVIQLLLNELTTVYDFLTVLSVNGIADEATQTNIRQFQKAVGLPQTGLVDLATWNRLAEQFHKYSTDYVS